MNIAILGTGISGLSMAQMLKSKHNVHLFEAQEDIGGLIKCVRVDDCLFHKVGGHVFNSKNEIVLDWFWSFFDKEKEFVKAKRNSKILFNNQVIGYPIENYLYSLPQELIIKIIPELSSMQRQEAKSPFEYDNFEDFLKSNFGETLYKIYFEPYNRKIWNTDLSEVPMEWLEGKLPMPNFDEILISNILRQEEGNMVHSSFYYPKNEGSQFIVNRLSEGINIDKSFNPGSVQMKNGKIYINGNSFDKLIYTGDIRNLPNSVQALFDDAYGEELTRELKKLKSNGTSNLFCETDKNDISWLYIPQNFTKAHRIIYTGNFSETNNRGRKRPTCVVEFSGYVEYKDMVEDIKKLPGNLSPISHNYEKNSYVIQDNQTRSLIKETKEYLSQYDIYLLGRFAEWEYYNMDKAIEAAMALSERL